MHIDQYFISTLLILIIFTSIDSAKAKESVDVINIATYLHTEPTVVEKNTVYRV